MPVTCPACGFASPDGMKFCGDCGERIVERPAEGVTRRLATILFADVTGSTALGERVDPETLRAIMNRYFETMRSVIESHGGTVEKFIGDAVMAVFGLPHLHEDDALRAVRAAVDIRAALDELNADLQRERGFEIRFRTGVNTGEVVAGDPASRTTLVTGDTVNTAARLEQAASPGDILLGHLTRTLVRDAATVEEVEPVAAKGKAEPVRAYRLVSVDAMPPRARGVAKPMVGRQPELATLTETFRGSVAEQASVIVTVVGQAGVGKSRLAEAFLEAIDGEATILRGHCLSYGAGITYWPIAEVVRAAAGVADTDSVDGARAKIRALFRDDADAADREADVSFAIGLASEAATGDDISWSVRRLFERLVDGGPLVVVVEDIHWAAPALLDLLEDLVAWSRRPLHLLCLARPDLLEDRATWGQGPHAVTVQLLPLSAEDVATMIDASLSRSGLPEAAIRQVITTADGNPLFVEEMLALLGDVGVDAGSTQGSDESTDQDPIVVPPSIHALLAARIDRLAVPERLTAQRASVIGRAFQRTAVAELGADTDRETLPRTLSALVRRQVIEPDPLTDSIDAYAFRHALLREAAYEGLSKSDRARLHERFADWVIESSGERLSEVEEIVAYHLERAHRYLVELGGSAEVARRLGDRASVMLGSAGERAWSRTDHDAAANLLGRARRLARDPTARVRYGDRLALSLFQLGRFRDTIELANEVIDEASAAGLVLAAANATLTALGARNALGEAEPAELWEVVGAARRRFEDAHDDEGLSRVFMLESLLLSLDGREIASMDAARASARHAEAAGDADRAARSLSYVADSYAYGPGEALAAIDEVEAGLAALRVQPDANFLAAGALAVLHAMAGNGERARAYLAESEAVALARGRTRGRSNRLPDGFVALLLNEPAVAIDVLAAEVDHCRSIGDERFGRQQAAMLGELLLRGGDEKGAREILDAIVAEPASDQLEVAARIELLQAGVASAEGDHTAAVDYARAAVDRLDATDWLTERGLAWLRLAEVTFAAGDLPGAESATRFTIELLTEKGNVASLARAHRLDEAIRARKAAEATVDALT